MTFPKEYLLYAAIAVAIGLVFSFGWVGMNHRPLPLQVEEDIYSPTTPPAPAVPTQAPQLVVDNTVKTGEFDPAAPPVVVTTAPLPTITPEPDVTVGMSDVCPTSSMTSNVGAALNITGVAMVVLGFATIMYMMVGLVSPGGGWGSSGMITASIMMIIVGGTFLFISQVILSAIVSAQSGIFCPP